MADANDTQRPRAPTVYADIPCRHCGKVFSPGSSMGKHCDWRCRFRSIQADFSGNGCWEWPLSVQKESGYGQFQIFGAFSTMESAHRASFRLEHGGIPVGLFVLHRCDNRRCFNPAHLFLGTAADNSADMMAKGRFNHDRDLRRLEEHPNAKLTVAATTAIRASNETAVPLAKRFGVSESAIRQARRGATWKSAP